MTEGPIVLITGASRGLGASMLTHLARAGFHVVGTYRERRDRADELVRTLRDAPGSVAFLPLDLAEDDPVPAFVDALRSVLDGSFDGRRMDAVINNAGIGAFAAYEHTTAEQFDRLMRVNVRGPFFLTQAVLPLLRDGGRIVNLSTALTRGVVPGGSAYAASKGAVEVLTRYQAVELASRGIRVNTLLGGAVATDFCDGIMYSPEIQERSAESVTLGRIGDPDEVTACIPALLSDAFPWTTGAIVDVSGGQHL